MLRSLRSPLRAGVFADRVWLALADKRVLSLEVAKNAEPFDTLATLLAQEHRQLRSAKVAVMTSDQFALQALVAPQPLLRERAEIAAYGRVSLDQAGLPLAATDIVNVVYRHASAPGLALSYSKTWLTSLGAAFAEHRMTPVRVLPATTSAFAYLRHVSSRGLAAAVINDSTACSLLVWNSGLLIQLDAEPKQSGDGAGIHRLLARTKAQFENIASIKLWHADSHLNLQEHGQAEQLRILTAQFYPEAVVTELSTWAILR